MRTICDNCDQWHYLSRSQSLCKNMFAVFNSVFNQGYLTQFQIHEANSMH